jgi:predicted transcriptional regulator
MWFLIMMNIIVLALLAKLYMLVYRFRRGDITKEEHSDMVVWTVKTAKRTAVPKNPPPNPKDEKQREKKDDLVQVLKILLKEGDRGVLLQTIVDRMGANRSNARRAVETLVEKKMVDEVVGVSGTKYYMTELGRNYCKRKSK